MNVMGLKFWVRAFIAIGLTGAVLVGGIVSSRADRLVKPQPGRRITPAGTLVRDRFTRQPAVGALPVDFVRSPDRDGPDGRGRYLVAVNSGFGIQFNAESKYLQSLAVIDLNARPEPAVIQNIYFPNPQSVSVGLAFARTPGTDGSFALFASGGNENRVWVFSFKPGLPLPISPASTELNEPVKASAIDLAEMAGADRQVFPLGLAISGDTLYTANNLADSLGIVRNATGNPRIEKIPLRNPARPGQWAYPYGVVAVGEPGREKVYVSCWGDASVAVVDPAAKKVNFIPVERHPTAMMFDEKRERLYVVNSNADSVSVIDTRTDREIERISVRLPETKHIGASPEGLALSGDGRTLYVANAHANAVAVISIAEPEAGSSTRMETEKGKRKEEDAEEENEEREERAERREKRERSRKKTDTRHPTPDTFPRLKGFIPTGFYPSAVAVVGDQLFVGNGKGSGMENSSVVVNETGLYPNAPNDRFPAGGGRGGRGGQYSVALVAGTISRIAMPDDVELDRHTKQVMRNAGLLGERRTGLFGGRSPFRHVIYVIKENRTYDAVFGDLAKAGDGTPADGDPGLAIFGSGDAAVAPDGMRQDIAPNHRELARRFGLFDRFFVNSEASPDGHNWSTAAFSSDYTDKAYRWGYSRSSRTYDFEGFNRLPNLHPRSKGPKLFPNEVGPAEAKGFLEKYIPYLNGGRDVAEPETLYLWDAAARAGLTYRNYGEFIGTVSEADLQAINRNQRKHYPDLSSTVVAIPTKKSLEGHHSLTFRNFDLETPDALTPESYLEAVRSKGKTDPVISANHPDERNRGNSRLGEWLAEFDRFAAKKAAGGQDELPNLSVVRLSNDHTAGLMAGTPTPQFYVADNDYALGRLVEAVSKSPYWKDTAIVVVEDDAQDGPDHVDCHRSVALVISAYNRPGALIHEYHTTVSLIRTIELMLGLAPMNVLDANAVPVDIFRDTPDLRPFTAVLPTLSPGNLTAGEPKNAAELQWNRKTLGLNLRHADMDDPRTLNDIIWFSVRGATSSRIAHLPAFDLLTAGISREAEEDDAEE
jgi:YVTN family beta-propeller protein